MSKFNFSIFNNEFWWFLVIILSLNFLLSFLFSYFFYKIAKKYKILDDPNSNLERKKQVSSVPLLVGNGFTLSSMFFCGVVWLTRKNFVASINPIYFWQGFADDLKFIFDFFPLQSNSNQELELSKVLGLNLQPFQLLAIFGGLIILLVAGFLDDKFQFKTKIMLLPTFLAICLAVFGGNLKIQNLSFSILPAFLEKGFFPYFLAFFWIGLCVSATKFLDGHDGLVGSIGIVNFLAIALVSIFSNVNQPLVFVFSLIWATGILGFLPFNLPNAKAYLGEAGSQSIGFMIGILSILSGAKIATAAAVIGWFIYDFIFVILYRIYNKKNPLIGDRKHWHYRLLDIGFSKIQVLWITILVVGISSFLAIILESSQKFYFLIFQGIAFFCLFVLTEFFGKKVTKIK
jgi:UDP-GlcNAc:undecaprenyl-phosphate/decaprenyl-phosphate GlcNAc-1-phosphate transferase